MMTPKFKFILNRIFQILVFIILLYNAYVKLSSSPGAVQLFTGLGLEPFGRFTIGILELTICLLIIYPPTIKYGAILGAFLMLGVIISHMTRIGIAINGDYTFFIMGIIVLICCLSLSISPYKKNYRFCKKTNS